MSYTVLDLFAGAGGLSLGFTQTNQFDIKVAFENNPNAKNTYKYNHPGVEVLGDVAGANYKDILNQFGKIDVVIGGPPCQGFSNANRQKNHAISKNNMLVKQYIRAVIELQPKVFVMENVSMLRSEVHRFFMEKTDIDIVDRYQIPVKHTEIFLLDAEYIFEGIVNFISDNSQVRKYIWDKQVYKYLNIIYKQSTNGLKLRNALTKHKNILKKIADNASNNKNNAIESYINEAFKGISEYYSEDIDEITLINKIAPAIQIQKMLSKVIEMYDNDIVIEKFVYDKGIVAIVKSFAVFDYIKHILGSKENGYIITSGILCAADFGAPQKRMRFVLMGVKNDTATEISLPEGTFEEDKYFTVSDAISDLENIKPIYEVSDDCGILMKSTKEQHSLLARSLCDSDRLYNHIITKTRDLALQRFSSLKPGDNFHSLADELKVCSYSNISRTQNTIYLRLDYNTPSGTVVNVRKSMWVHPVLNRAVSVREAARLQTFPDSFVFCGTKDSQYQQVGNAVPPVLAKAIANKVAIILNNELLDK